MQAARGDCSVGSFWNCHARGLHSVVLRDDPMVRMFVTTIDHEMWKMGAYNVPSSIAFHSHQTDLKLESVRGKFTNWMMTFGPSEPARFKEFAWDSAIGGGAGKFESTGAVRNARVSLDFIPEGQAVVLAAEEVHTVSVWHGERAAWLVTEGLLDPAYKAFSYSREDLTAFTPEGLYVPMTRAQADDLIDWATA